MNTTKQFTGSWEDIFDDMQIFCLELFNSNLPKQININIAQSLIDTQQQLIQNNLIELKNALQKNHINVMIGIADNNNIQVMWD